MAIRGMIAPLQSPVCSFYEARMPRFRSVLHLVLRGVLLPVVVVLPARAQNARPQQQAVPSWLAADREVLAKEANVAPPPEIRRLVWHRRPRSGGWWRCRGI
jgi:hypothetical protein